MKPHTLHWLWCILALPLSYGSAAEPPEGFRMTVERIGPAPLPYQSTRVRITLANTRAEPIVNVRPPEAMTWLMGFKPPGGQAFREPAGTWYRFRPRPADIGLVYPPPKDPWDSPSVRLTLAAGQAVTLSATYGPHVDNDGIFFEPGAYQLKFGHKSGGPGGYEAFPDKPLEVRVGQPAGPDAAVYELIQKKEGLRVALGCARRPQTIYGKEVIADLGEIVAKHPQSSYADYARYILGLRHLSYRIGEQGRREQDAEDIAAAAKMLEGINCKDFALGAEVLVWLKNHSKDPAKVKEYEQRLAADFYDSFERLEDLGKKLTWEQLLEARQPPKGAK